MVTQLSSPKGAQRPPPFSAHVYRGQMAGWIKMALGMEVGLGPGHIVLDGGTHLPSPKKEQSPQFSAHFSCGQTAGWTKMALGMEVGLGPGDCVRWGPSSPEIRHSPSQFLAHVYSGQMAGWMKTPLGTEVDLDPGHIVLQGPSYPTKGAEQPAPLFSAHVLL